jgi:hypothetical protein
VPIRHVWSRQDADRGWLPTDRIEFEISGGREGGYRGFSFKRAVTPGKWRVEVETGDGRILGRIDFTVLAVEGKHPTLESKLIP